MIVLRGLSLNLVPDPIEQAINTRSLTLRPPKVRESFPNRQARRAAARGHADRRVAQATIIATRSRGLGVPIITAITPTEHDDVERM